MSFEERTVIPFEAALLRGERLLVLAPHPDDEVIGCGGLIAQHCSEHRPVRVVIATDGAAATEDAGNDYIAERENESREGLSRLGAAEPLFLRLRDRHLSRSQEELRTAIRKELAEFKPDLIAVTSPLEIHPDHVALCRALFDVLHGEESLVATLAMSRIAFYEVSQPFRPNTLVDITGQSMLKREALAAHKSQTAVRPYDRFTRGLNQYRSMTLPPEVEEAEAYWVVGLPAAARTSWSELARQMSAASPIEITRASVTVATIIRTKNRLDLLREAMESVQRNTLRPELIIVNDGGESPAPLLGAHPNAKLVDLGGSVGRSEAMNRGVEATSADLITFLDDDDLFFADHIETLTEAASREAGSVHYTDAVSVFLARGERGEWREEKRLTLYGTDFDPALLAVDNFIPLLTLGVRRDDYLAAGGFDAAFDLFEDWDFLIRLQKLRPSFVRIPRITCEVRHFPESGSIVMAATRSFDRLAEGKRAIWSRHAELLEPSTLSRALELQKRRMEAARSDAADKGGRVGHLELDVMRLTREKEQLIREIETMTHTHADTVARMEGAIREAGRSLDEHREVMATMQEHLTASSSALDELREDQRQKEELQQKLYAEIARLNALLETIYASRSWKLHQLAERLSGRG